MREKYESLSAVVLKDLAKARGLKNISSMKKSDLIELMLAEDERQEKDKKVGNLASLPILAFVSKPSIHHHNSSTSSALL